MSKLSTLIPLFLAAACGTADEFTATGAGPEADGALTPAEGNFEGVRGDLPTIDELDPGSLKGVSASLQGTVVELANDAQDIWPAYVEPGIYQVEVTEVYEDSCNTGLPNIMQAVVVQDPDTGERKLFDIATIETDGEWLYVSGSREYPNPDYDCSMVALVDAQGATSGVNAFDLQVLRMDQFVGSECGENVPSTCTWDYDATFRWVGDFQDDGSSGE